MSQYTPFTQSILDDLNALKLKYQWRLDRQIQSGLEKHFVNSVVSFEGSFVLHKPVEVSLAYSLQSGMMFKPLSVTLRRLYGDTPVLVVSTPDDVQSHLTLPYLNETLDIFTKIDGVIDKIKADVYK